jgi:hypothetical protein
MLMKIKAVIENGGKRKEETSDLDECLKKPVPRPSGCAPTTPGNHWGLTTDNELLPKTSYNLPNATEVCGHTL